MKYEHITITTDDVVESSVGHTLLVTTFLSLNAIDYANSSSIRKELIGNLIVSFELFKNLFVNKKLFDELHNTLMVEWLDSFKLHLGNFAVDVNTDADYIVSVDLVNSSTAEVIATIDFDSHWGA